MACLRPRMTPSERAGATSTASVINVWVVVPFQPTPGSLPGSFPAQPVPKERSSPTGLQGAARSPQVLLRQVLVHGRCQDLIASGPEWPYAAQLHFGGFIFGNASCSASRSFSSVCDKEAVALAKCSA
eukprot:Skav227936  [mRNA]  locus=scaffold146:449802:450379:- [translate_table: standard]